MSDQFEFLAGSMYTVEPVSANVALYPCNIEIQIGDTRMSRPHGYEYDHPGMTTWSMKKLGEYAAAVEPMLLEYDAVGPAINARGCNSVEYCEAVNAAHQVYLDKTRPIYEALKEKTE